MRKVPVFSLFILLTALLLSSTEVFADRHHGHTNVYGTLSMPGLSIGFGRPGVNMGGYYNQPYTQHWPIYGNYGYDSWVMPQQPVYVVPRILQQVLVCPSSQFDQLPNGQIIRARPNDSECWIELR